MRSREKILDELDLLEDEIKEAEMFLKANEFKVKIAYLNRERYLNETFGNLLRNYLEVARNVSAKETARDSTEEEAYKLLVPNASTPDYWWMRDWKIDNLTSNGKKLLLISKDNDGIVKEVSLKKLRRSDREVAKEVRAYIKDRRLAVKWALKEEFIKASDNPRQTQSAEVLPIPAVSDPALSHIRYRWPKGTEPTLEKLFEKYEGLI